MSDPNTRLPKSNKTLLHDPSSSSLHVATLPPPDVPPGYHLIRVHATALTSGELLWTEPRSLHQPVPGFDVAGTVVTSAPDSPFQPGDEVYALTSFNRQGAAREYTVALPEELALKPKNLSWEEAATVPLSALTAWQALFVHGGLQPPELDVADRMNGANNNKTKKRVLVTAAAGGVGVWAVQLARLAGAHVTGTCGPSNIDFVRGLGADDVLDYRFSGLHDWVVVEEERRKVDLVIDCVGGSTLEEAWTCVKGGGKIVSVAEPAEPKRPATGVAPDVTGIYFVVEPDGKQLGDISKLIERKECRPVLDSVWNLDEWERAFEKLDGKHARGKVVLKVRS